LCFIVLVLPPSGNPIAVNNKSNLNKYFVSLCLIEEDKDQTPLTVSFVISLSTVLERSSLLLAHGRGLKGFNYYQTVAVVCPGHSSLLFSIRYTVGQSNVRFHLL
jgi:hypothetical protein